MKTYIKSKHKIKHPWWHCFFTNLLSYGDDNSWDRYYCSKCKKVFHFNNIMVDVEIVVSNDN